MGNVQFRAAGRERDDPLTTAVKGHLLGHDMVVDMERQRLRGYVTLALADFLCLTLPFLASNLFYLGRVGTGHGATMASVLVPVYFSFAVFIGAYRGDVLAKPLRGSTRSMHALALAGSVILLIAYSFKVTTEFSRGVFWLGMLSTAASLFLVRFYLGRRLLARMGGTPYNTVVIEAGGTYSAAPHDLIVRADELGFDPATNDPDEYHRVASLVAHADRVIVSCPPSHYADWAKVLKSMAVNGEVLTDAEDELGILGIGRHGGQPTMIVSAGPLHLRDRMIKRTFDLVVGTLALVVLTPVFLTVAIAIRMESRGPVLFRQKRIGQDNKMFEILKFRSMYHDLRDQDAARLTLRGDDRVTRVGRYIRRTSIDELPQLVNVLRGEMSIVGPRPHAVAAKADQMLYWDIDPRYRFRHSVKPGLTGLAQVRGFRGATDRREDLTNRLSADLEYLSDWSMGRDLWIILKTFFVLRHQNAY